MATPTMSNARKPYHQLSSCFVDTVPDSLDGIYRSLDNFAKVSKFGGDGFYGQKFFHAHHRGVKGGVFPFAWSSEWAIIAELVRERWRWIQTWWKR